MKDTLKKVIKYIISVTLAVVLLWVSFREVNWTDFMSGVKECRWIWVIVSMLAGAFAFWLRAIRWRQLLLPLDDSITRTTTFNGINIGNISNFLFPRIGEFVRCGVIVRHSKRSASSSGHTPSPGHASSPCHAPSPGHASPCHAERSEASASYEKVLGTVVLERGWELLVMLMLLAVVLVAGFDRFGSFFVERIWEPMVQKFDTGIWWMLLVLCVLGAGALALFWRLRNSNAFCAKIWGVFKGIAQGFSTCFKMEHKWLFFAYTAFIWMTYWFMAYAIVKAAPFLDNLDLIDALFLSLVGGLGFAVPVPGGIGAFHFIISMTLSVMYGVPVELGVVYATLSHTSQAITQIVFGLGSYAYEAFAVRRK